LIPGQLKPIPARGRMNKTATVLLVVWVVTALACNLPGWLPFLAPTAAPTQTPLQPTATLPPTPIPTPAPAQPPVLVETQPLPQGELLTLGPLVLTFNQPMERASVEGALQGQPALSGKFEWVDDYTVKFLPDNPFTAGSQQKIIVSTIARSNQGLALQEAVELSYQVADYLRVSERLPKPDAIDITPGSAVVASFSTPVVALGIDSSKLPVAFSLAPAANGRGEWLNTSTYIFYPDPPLQGGKLYTVTLNAQLTSTNGMGLAPDQVQVQTWNFTTAKPKLLSHKPENSTEIDLDAVFELNFNQPMNPHSVEENFTLQDAIARRVPGKFNWNDAFTQVKYKPDLLLDRSSVYTLILLGATQAAGGTELGDNLLQTYTTVANVMVSGVSQPENSNFAGGWGVIFLNFTAPLAQQNMENLVTFKPAVDGVSYYVAPGSKQVTVNGIFKPNTTYNINIMAGVRDLWQGVLTKPFKGQFKTVAAPPALTVPMLLTGTRVVFVPPNEKSVRAQSTNLMNVTTITNSLGLDDFITLATSPDGLGKTFDRPPDAKWQQSLSPTPNQTNEVGLLLAPSGKILTPGLYYYAFQAPGLNVQGDGYPAFLTVVSRVQLTLKVNSRQVVAWAANLDDDSPMANQTVVFYDDAGKPLGTGTTDAQGLCSFDLTAALDTNKPVIAVVGKPGEDNFGLAMSTWTQNIAGWSFGLPTISNLDERKVYLYTDRPIYQPGQSVNFRAIIRQNSNGRYTPLDINQVTIKLTGDYSVETGLRPQLGTTTLQLSSYGSVNGSFTLPEDAPPGYYSLEVDGFNDQVDFQVAQYQKPEIEVKVDFTQAEISVGQDLEATVKAYYYFGAPAGNAAVSWSLTSTVRSFDLPDGYQVGKVDLGWSQPMGEAFGGFGSGVRFITSGETRTAADGTVKIWLPGKELEGMVDPQLIQTLTLEATIGDESAMPVSGRGLLPLHPADFYIGVRPSAWSVAAGTEIGFDIQTVNWQAAPSGSHALNAKFQKMIWKHSTSLDRTGIYPLVVEYTQTGVVDYQTDSGGRARLVFVPPDPGMYMLETSGDPRSAGGEGAITQTIVWVGGTATATWPELPDQHLRLSADSAAYQPGQTAHIFIPNPFGGHTLALITVERSKVMRSQVIYLTKASEDLALSLTEEDAPNVYVSVTLLGRTPDGRPDFRQGYQELTVDPLDQTLQVELVSQPEKTGPGDQVKFSIRVKDDQGKPVQGEFSLALVDKAVLALAEPNAPDILKAFYGRQPLGVTSSLALAVYAQRILPFNAVGGGGGGPGAATALRENFQDTAFWNGSIVTDENGLAEVSLSLPDNLTTWVADLRGLTKDTQVGSAVKELVASKDLMVRPETPRFLVEGDYVQLAALVHNNTENDLDVEVSLQATGFTLDGASQATQVISVPPGGREKVTWWGTAQSVDQVELIFSARSGDLSDTARPEPGKLPVLHYSSPQTFATSGVLASEAERTELVGLPHSFTPTGGELRVELAPSLAATILSGLDALETFPTDFTEPLLSRLLPNLETYQTLQKLGIDNPALKSRLDAAIADGLERLAASQNQDGGWGWGAGQESDAYITAYVLLGLSQASQAAFVDANILGRAQAYLVSKRITPDLNTKTWQLDSLVLQNYALKQSGWSGFNPADLAGLYDLRDKLNPWARALLSMTISAVDPKDERARTLLSDLEGSAVRSSTGAHWENTLPDGANLSSPNFNTAVVLLALAKQDPAVPVLADATLYLVAHRANNGCWASSYESAWVLMALGEVMKATGDLQANFAFSASLNGSPVLNGKAGGPDTLTAVTARLPLDKLNATASNPLQILREAGDGRLYYRAYLQLDRPVESAQPVTHGLTIGRSYTLGGQDCQKQTCALINGLKLGEINPPVIVRLTLNLPTDMQFLVVEDYIPAGTEIVDASLKTTQQIVKPEELPYDPANPFGQGWGWWYFGDRKVYSDHIRWVGQSVPAGTYVLTYRLQTVQAGDFRVVPAHAYEYYFPEVEGSGAGSIFTIAP